MPGSVTEQKCTCTQQDDLIEFYSGATRLP